MAEAEGSKLVSVSKLLLTYPQCEELPVTLLGFLRETQHFKCGVVAGETHHETEGKHLHAVYITKEAWKVRRNTLSKAFDWTVGDKTYHPNVEIVGRKKTDLQRVVAYVIKDGNYVVENMDVDAIVKGLHRRKFDTKTVLETPIAELVEQGMIAPGQYTSILRAQQHWRLRTPAPDTEDVKGIWLYGGSGCGKSTWARAFAMDNGGMYLKAQNKWWDGYEGQRVVVLDDLDIAALNHYLKIWADKWACTGEVKCGTVNLYHHYLVVTSNYTIQEIVQKGEKSPESFDENLYEALSRRFKVMTLPEGQSFFVYDGKDWKTDERGQIVRKTPEGEPEHKRAPE